MKQIKTALIAIAIPLGFMTACSSGGDESADSGEDAGGASFLAEGASGDDAMIAEGKGVGPTSSVTLGDIDDDMATAGKALFDGKCMACHRFTDEKFVGPGLKGVTNKRKPEWIMNMIVNPQEMIEKDPVAKAMFEEYGTPMTNMGVDEADARKILEYMRQMDAAG